MALFTDTLLESVISREQEDKWIWLAGKDKVYTVKSAYASLLNQLLFLNSEAGLSNLFSKFWVCCAPKKVLAFS